MFPTSQQSNRNEDQPQQLVGGGGQQQHLEQLADLAALATAYNTWHQGQLANSTSGGSAPRHLDTTHQAMMMKTATAPIVAGSAMARGEKRQYPADIETENKENVVPLKRAPPTQSILQSEAPPSNNKKAKAEEIDACNNEDCSINSTSNNSSSTTSGDDAEGEEEDVSSESESISQQQQHRGALLPFQHCYQTNQAATTGLHSGFAPSYLPQPAFPSALSQVPGTIGWNLPAHCWYPNHPGFASQHFGLANYPQQEGSSYPFNAGTTLSTPSFPFANPFPSTPQHSAPAQHGDDEKEIKQQQQLPPMLNCQQQEGFDASSSGVLPLYPSMGLYPQHDASAIMGVSGHHNYFNQSIAIEGWQQKMNLSASSSSTNETGGDSGMSSSTAAEASMLSMMSTSSGTVEEEKGNRHKVVKEGSGQVAVARRGSPLPFHGHHSIYHVCTVVPGRLAMLSHNVKYQVTLGEILRRILPPECLNASYLGGILRKAKNKDGGKALREYLHRYGINLPSGRRKSRAVTAFTALCEQETAKLATDYQDLSDEDFPKEELAAALLLTCAINGGGNQEQQQQQQGSNSSRERKLAQVASAHRIVGEIIGIVGAVEKIIVAETVEPTQRQPLSMEEQQHLLVAEGAAREGLTKFSRMTHGFGNVAMLTAWRCFQEILNHCSTKLMEGGSGGTNKAPLNEGGGGHITQKWSYDFSQSSYYPQQHSHLLSETLNTPSPSTMPMGPTTASTSRSS